MRKIFKYVLLSTLFLIVSICAIFWKNDIPLETLKAKYAQSPSKFIGVMGMNVHYREEGNPNDSIPLVLIHGTGASLHTWEGWVNDLKSENRIIRMDLPAYGLTGPNVDGDYSQDFYVSFINEFLEKLNIKKCEIGGNSLGGSVAWNYVVKYPEKVKKMILVDAGGYPMKSQKVPIAFKIATIPILKNIFKYITPRVIVEKSVTNVYGDQSKVTNELVDRYFELSLREGNRGAFLNRIKSGLFTDNSSKIKSIKVPTLIIWGEKDLLIPIDVANRFHADLPNDTLLIFKDLGHVPMEENPKETVRIVKEFLVK